MKKIPIHWQIIIALVLAVIFGVYFRPYIQYVEWMGTAFMHAIKLVIMPLVMFAIISGVSNIGISGNIGKVGITTIVFYSITTSMAILTGLLLVNIIQPGVGITVFEHQNVVLNNTTNDFIPDNFFRALYEQNMVVIVFSALLFGYYITKIETSNRLQLTNFFASVFDVIMKVTQLIIKVSPLGIFGLVASVIAKQADPSQLFTKVLWYMLTVLLALAIHGFITLPLMVKFWGKAKPYKHFRYMSAPLLTAFSTCSSGAALPYTIDAVQNKAGVSKKITNFVIPLGGTMNFDGTALYECVAAIFIAQVYGVHLTFVGQLIVVLMSLMASFAGAAVPMAGLFMMPIVLKAVGLPFEGIALLLPVDRFLDMARTTINVWSDCCASVVVAKSEGETLNV